MYKRMQARNMNPSYADPLNFDVNLDQSWDNLMFRTRFIEAAVSLAKSLDIAVENLGCLFDRILSTGTKGKIAEESKAMYERKIDEWASDYGGSVHGITLKLNTSEGVILFLVRKLENARPFYHLTPGAEKAPSTDHMESYQARGYRMAEPRFFARAFAARVGVNTAEMEVFLSACRTFAKRGHKYAAQKGGIYVSIYGVRPCGRGTDNDLEVLVYNFAHHQIPSFRLPEVKGIMTEPMMRWVQTRAGKSLGDVLKEANEWIHASDEVIPPSEASDQDFVDFITAFSVSLEGLIGSLRVWPSLLQEAKLSADIVHMPGASDQELPVQSIIFELVLPAPEIRLTKVPSNVVPIDEMERHRMDRAPAPFIYTPFSLFCKTQSQIHKGPRYRAHARITTAELNRLYPPIAEDAAEIAMMDEKIEQTPPATGPFSDSIARIHQLWAKDRNPDYGSDPTSSSTRYSLGEKGSPALSNSSDGDKTLVRPTNESANSLQIPTEAPRGRRSRPGTAGEVINKIGQFVGRNREASVSREDLPAADEKQDSKKPAMPPMYAWVRDVYDGWYIRHTEWLEETDRTGMMEGNGWRVQAIGPGGM